MIEFSLRKNGPYLDLYVEVGDHKAHTGLFKEQGGEAVEIVSRMLGTAMCILTSEYTEEIEELERVIAAIEAKGKYL